MSITIFLLLAAALMAVGLPVAFALGLGTSIFIMANDIPVEIIIRRMFTGIDTTILLCIPFFILAGDIMAEGGIASRLVNVCRLAVGRLSGGFSFVCIVACTFFAAITGSNIACCVAMGAVLIPAMVDNGYSRSYATAVTCGGSILGPIIPPSIAMIMYASLVPGVSISDLYLLGVPAGIILSVALCDCSYILCKRLGYGAIQFSPDERKFKNVMHTIKDSIWALGMPIIILGGIFGGVTTPTEASVLAVLWAIFVGHFVYKEITIKDLFPIFLKSAKNTARILTIISLANLFSWAITYVNLAKYILAGLGSLTSSPSIMLALMLGIMFIMGLFMEPGPIVIITIPLFYPILKVMHIDLVYFGVVSSIITSLGCITFPFGSVLFAGSFVGKVPVSILGKELLPFILTTLLIVILFIIYPALITWIL